ncbi:hypothetical protein C4J88_2241 [Pseudomonas sp. R4-39-08]|nr:hypothetical protein C4J88_2241 [Pseudomonas sp. R4-39-08]
MIRRYANGCLGVVWHVSLLVLNTLSMRWVIRITGSPQGGEYFNTGAYDYGE